MGGGEGGREIWMITNGRRGRREEGRREEGRWEEGRREGGGEAGGREGDMNDHKWEERREGDMDG